MQLSFLYDLIGQYGLYGVLILVMIEGDITLLIAGVLAHSHFFGEYSFARVLLYGTVGGVLSDHIAYATGRGFRKGVSDLRFYQSASPRMERLTTKFGPLSIFLSKYIYGLRWATCIFYGVSRMPFFRFLFLSVSSCFLWVFVLSGAGYFFSGAVMGLIGDFQRLGKSVTGNRGSGNRRLLFGGALLVVEKSRASEPGITSGVRTCRSGKVARSKAGVSGAYSLYPCAP